MGCRLSIPVKCSKTDRGNRCAAFSEEAGRGTLVGQSPTDAGRPEWSRDLSIKMIAVPDSSCFGAEIIGGLEPEFVECGGVLPPSTACGVRNMTRKDRATK